MKRNETAKKKKAEDQNGLMKLYVDQLKDMYSAENQIIKALPKLIKAASAPELRAAFKEHLEITKGQVVRLEEVFESLDAKPKGKKCAGMEGLLKEGSELLEEDLDNDVLDAGLIGAAQKVEHYEIAAYGTLIAHANLLGQTHAAKAFKKTLAEEREADEALTEIAETAVNADAAAG